MPDVEKVISELFKFREEMRTCNSTTYVIASKKVRRMDLIDKTISLLQAQEPMMVKEMADTDTINCPKCGQQFARVGRDESIYLDTDEEPNYCPKCGQAVKWE